MRVSFRLTIFGSCIIDRGPVVGQEAMRLPELPQATVKPAASFALPFLGELPQEVLQEPMPSFGDEPARRRVHAVLK